MSDLSGLERPRLLDKIHDLAGFDSGEPVLDDWLRRRALTNIKLAATRTYVVCSPNTDQVVGYYSLCMSQIVSTDVIGSMRRNMPRSIPAILLGRLAVDRAWQGTGLGTKLLRDATERSLRASQEISARLLIVHAISDMAEAFYQKYGFTRLPLDTPTLALDLVKLEAISNRPKQ